MRPLAALAVLVAVGGQEAPEWSGVEVSARPDLPEERLLEGGARAYGWHCLPCHGPDGRGDGPNAVRLGIRPRDFTRGLFMLKSSVEGEMPFDEDLYRTISAGVPVAGMPAFREAIPPEDRWALVAFLKTLAAGRFADAPARTRIAAPEGTADPGRGGRLYREVLGCAGCHGDFGRGDGPAAPLLRDGQDRPASMPDFARGTVEFKAGSRPEDVYRVLATGLEGSAMPSFASVPEADRRDVAAFVATLYRPVALGERLYLRRGCGACHTRGRGRHLGPDLAGITARRSRDWLRRWMEDPERMMSVDEDARELLREYRIPMPAPGLGPAEIDAVLDFLATK